MGLRKAGAYSKRYARPYTRKSKVKTKTYIKAIPNSKVVKMKHGDVVKFEQGKFPVVLNIVSKEKVQIRDNAIEAVRQYLNRFLVERVGKDFYLEVKIYPHHIIRENKMLTGAGADRMQTGMALSFGKTMGRAALVKAGQTIMTIAVSTPKDESTARQLIASCKARLPCTLQVDTIRKPTKQVN